MFIIFSWKAFIKVLSVCLGNMPLPFPDQTLAATRSSTYAEEADLPLSRSAEKQQRAPLPDPDAAEREPKYRLVDLNCISVNCTNCMNNNTCVVESVVRGCSSKLQLFCEDCTQTFGEFETSLYSKDVIDVNRRVVLAIKETGGGYSNLEKFCSTMNMPCMAKETFSKHHKSLKRDVSEHLPMWKKEIALAVKAAYIEAEPGNAGLETINISVSYDGTWHKRGFKSHTGLGIVIDALTGLVLDFEVLSNFCSSCIKQEKSLSTEEFEVWQDIHKDVGQCEQNFTGSAGAMEVEAAKRLWARSVETFGLRYTTMLSDGDCKSHQALVEESVYGKDVLIIKTDCVNHVSKRLGTALRSLKKSGSQDSVKIGGRGRLTDERIKKWQGYYYAAIKKNAGDVDAMQKGILAILFHAMSSADSHCHVHCPSGAESWCYHQRAVAQGTDPVMPGHHEPIPKDLGMKLFPIFKRLSSLELLKRCDAASTQNANESVNKAIWAKVPKTVFVNKSTVLMGASMAIRQYNQGPKAAAVTQTELGLEIGHWTKKLSSRAQKRSADRAKRDALQVSKDLRKQKKMSDVALHSKHEKKEGILYAPGLDCGEESSK